MADNATFAQSPALEDKILEALGILFQAGLVTAIATDDPLRLNVLKVAPLQDDPTTTAPYLTYGADEAKGIVLMPKELEKQYGSIEIGGPIRYLYHYTATCGSPFQGTREACLSQINNLCNRIAMILIQHYDLSTILGDGELQSDDESKRLEGANKLLVDSIVATLEGGEQTWFGKGVLCWHYPVSWYV
jgi:hypothetical protein